MHFAILSLERGGAGHRGKSKLGKVVHSQARSLIVRMFLADVGGKSFVATGGGGGTGGIGRGPASVQLPSGWHS